MDCYLPFEVTGKDVRTEYKDICICIAYGYTCRYMYMYCTVFKKCSAGVCGQFRAEYLGHQCMLADLRRNSSQHQC